MTQQLDGYSPAPNAFEEGPQTTPRRVIPRWRPAYALAVLVIVFLSLGVWNLGDLRAPSSDFVPEKGAQDIYLDLGATIRVDKVFLLVQDASTVDVDLYWGSPESWNLQRNLKTSGIWRKWEEVYFGRETRYIRLLFKSASGRIGEIALFSGSQRLDISAVIGEGGEEVGTALIDEQHLIYDPTSHKSGTYFDEIYFVRTAEQHLQLEEPSQWDHPPMSKLIIASSIAVFGHNPFAWRIPGVILSALMIVIVYLLAKRMFNSPRAGLIAAFLLTFDFMHFVQARMATPETFILFFVIAMFYFFYRYSQDPSRRGKYLFLSLVFFGLGFSTKWVVMWGFVGLILLLLIVKWRKPIHRSELYWFVGGLGAAVAIYLLSYIPYFLAGHGLGDLWDLQFSMLRFHSGLEATHPYSSEWYTWPLMLTPVYLSVGSLYETTSYIATFGNPALWWPSIPLVLATLWLALGRPSLWRVDIGQVLTTLWLVPRKPSLWWPSICQAFVTPWLVLKRGDKTAAFIVIPFLAQWLSFIFISRILFIYHFFPNVLFIILASTLWMERLRGRWKWVVIGYLTLNVVTFAFFYPVISGHLMTQGYWDSLRWLVGWVT